MVKDDNENRRRGDVLRQDALLQQRVRDAFESAARYNVKFIGFLDPREAMIAEKAARRLKTEYPDCAYCVFGGYDGAERVYLGVFPPYSEASDKDFPIEVINIKWRFKTLSHRDFLGALIGLGISRGKIGDIVVGDDECTVFTEKAVGSFAVQNLGKVGSAGVVCSVCDGITCLPEKRFKPIGGTVASKRLDCVVSALTGCSRGGATELIAGGLVSVDYDIRYDNSYETDEGATVSIRGHGRFVIDRLGPGTKKGRLGFSARKYL